MENIMGHSPILFVLGLILVGVFYLAWTIRGFVSESEKLKKEITALEGMFMTFKKENKDEHHALEEEQKHFSIETKQIHEKLFTSINKVTESLARIEGFIKR